jgi:hypothetical protein
MPFYQGVIHGRSIELAVGPGLPDGQQGRIAVEPAEARVPGRSEAQGGIDEARERIKDLSPEPSSTAARTPQRSASGNATHGPRGPNPPDPG